MSHMPYPHWERECHHLVFFKAPSFTVGGGTIPPHTACPMHYHAKPTCVVSTKSTTPVTVLELQPPNFDQSNPKSTVRVINQGDCFTQAFPNTIVHSYISTDIPGAFIIIETNIPVMVRDSPFSEIDGDGVKVVRKQNHCFWSSQLLHIEPGATATVSNSYLMMQKDERRLGTVVSRLGDSMNNLFFDAPNRKVHRFAQSASGHHFEVAILEDVKNVPRQFCIHNHGTDSWEGMLVDIFGADEA